MLELISAFDISIAGRISENKLTDIRIPAANPSEISRNFELIFLVKNTVEAPKAIINQVSRVTINVKLKGFILISNTISHAPFKKKEVT